jgi:hypothetical protein
LSCKENGASCTNAPAFIAALTEANDKGYFSFEAEHEDCLISP